MNNNPRFAKKRVGQIVAAAVLTGVSSGAFAGDFSLVDNKITWTLGSSAEAVIGSNGLAGDISIARSSSASSLPNVSFQLVDNENSTGEFNVRLFMEVKSENPALEIEMTLGVVKVTTSGGEVTGASMVTSGPGSERIFVFAKRGSMGLSADFSTISGMISSSGNTITVQTSNIVAALGNRDELFNQIIERFATNGEYEYRIGIKHISTTSDIVGDISRIGTTANGTFTASPLAAPTIWGQVLLSQLSTLKLLM